MYIKPLISALFAIAMLKEKMHNKMDFFYRFYASNFVIYFTNKSVKEVICVPFFLHTVQHLLPIRDSLILYLYEI